MSTALEILIEEITDLRRSHRDLQARFKIMQEFFVKEFPKHFAGEAALVLATDNEILGETVLPDINPIDLRSDAEKANGECYHLSDMVRFEEMHG